MRRTKLLLIAMLTVSVGASSALILTPDLQAEETAPAAMCPDQACWNNSTDCFDIPGGICVPQPRGSDPQCIVIPC